MAFFSKYSAHIFNNASNKRYVSFIYDGEKFLPIHTYIAAAADGELYTVDGNYLVEAGGLILAAKDSISNYVMNE